MMFDLIIISYNTRKLVAECIDSAISTANGILNKIIVVDNNSSDDTVAFLRKNYPNVEIICNQKNMGYSFAVNCGVRCAESPLLLISNSDIVFLDGAIKNLAKLFHSDNSIAVSAVRQIYPNGKMQYSFGGFPNRTTGIKDALFINNLCKFFDSMAQKLFQFKGKVQDVDYADGGMMAVRKSDFDKVGGFDEDYFFYSEDMDFCFRIKQSGARVVFCPNSQVIHYRGGSNPSQEKLISSLEDVLQSKVKFARKHLSDKEFLFYAQSQIFKAKAISTAASLLEFSAKFKNSNHYNQETVKHWTKIKNEIIRK